MNENTSNEIQKVSPVVKNPPVEKTTLDLFLGVGVVLGIVGVIAGFVTIANAPEYAYSTEARALKTAAWIWGISEIVGGVLTGFVFYVIAGIGQAVIDIWINQNKKSAGN